MSFAQIARIVGLSEAHTKKLFYQALKKLHVECERHGLDITDIIGKPRSMMEMMEDLA